MRIPAISGRPFVGLLLVALGVMLLLDTVDALGADTAVFGTYWPALLIAWGLGGLAFRGFRASLSHIMVLAIGVLFLLNNLNLLSWNVGQLWPVLLVILGLSLLFVRRGRGSRPRRWRGLADSTSHSYVMGGGRERITTKEYQGGDVTAVFGGVEMDFREAGLAGGQATLDATVICGGLELKVPKDWSVNVQTSTLLGGVDNKRQQPAPGEATAELTITGTVVCGGIDIKE